MKRYIYDMAIPKHDAKIKIESYASIIQRHVIECVVYGDREGTKNHWIAEISAWLAKISRIKCKSKLTRKDYEEALFSAYGDELSDAEFSLEEYLDSSVRKARYPEFEISEELVTNLFNAYQKFISVCLNKLTSGIMMLEEDWSIELTNIF